MNDFDIMMNFRVFFGRGMARKIGEIVKRFKAEKVMVVTDPGILAAGLDSPVLQGLHSAGLETAVFHDVVPDPTTKNVEDGVELAKQFSPDVIIGLGGGSVIDAAKAINIVRTRGGRISEYRGVVNDGTDLPPLIAVPTTAGTGSEVSPFLLISDSITHAKIVVKDIKAAPDIAVLDPSLTVSLPRQVTVLTGVDALVHSVEAFVANGSQPYSQGLAMEAIRLIVQNLPEVAATPKDVFLRGNMLTASNLAGMAMSISYLGLAHSTANPLSRIAGMTHGLAVGMMIPYVVEFNKPAAKMDYLRIAKEVLAAECPASPDEATSKLAVRLRTFMTGLGLPETLEQAGVSRADLSELSREAISQATVKANPREPSLDDIMSIYEAAFEGRIR